MAVIPAPFLSKLSAPHSSSSERTSETYDWSGLDDHIKRQDAVGALRDNKFASLYSGDVAGSVTAGNKIRDLLTSLRSNAPGTTERNPNQIASPLVRLQSRSTETSSNAGGGGVEFDHGPQQQQMRFPPAQDPPPQVNPKQHAPGATNVPAPAQKRPAASLDLPGAAPSLPDFYRAGGVNSMRLPSAKPPASPQAAFPEKEDEVADALDPFLLAPKPYLASTVPSRR